LLLCLGTLHEMGTGPQDTMAAIEHFLQRNKIFSAHFRNPRGTVPNGGYQEDFLDEGDLDMLAVMRLLHKYDYQGSLDPDHAVGIAGDAGGRIAFAWELGYMKALKAAVEAGA
jgi:mannonate dehydratase